MSIPPPIKDIMRMKKAVVVTPEPRELRKILRIIHNSIKMHKKLIRILIDIQSDIDKGNHKKQYLSRLNREKNDFLVSTTKRKIDCSLASLREYHFVHDSSNNYNQKRREIFTIFLFK